MKEEEEEEVAGDGALLVGRSLTHCTLTLKKKSVFKKESSTDYGETQKKRKTRK